eukprot:TRINITY_DN23127_c0_g3_i1.p1 TRINITY_DN23127_c0_g3~~TRINITY_DN23127_c0_g3_i1.p1  ORF type:complete len:1889 (-),score=342.21 TRINITY_DN23127_c0_g3_i1:234-5135(-)
MADAQRAAAAAERQAQDVGLEIETMTQRIKRLEEELQIATAARSSAEREKEKAYDAVTKARETLRMRDLSILELRNNCERADQQLSEALSDRERRRADMEASMKRLDADVREMASELDHWKTEASSLSEALRRCDRRVIDLRDKAETARHNDGGDAELLALKRQLDEAIRDLTEVQSSREQARSHIEELEVATSDARAKLKAREQQVEEGRRRVQAVRAEAGDVERELVVQVGKVAQLEGQVDENQRQYKHLQGQLAEVQKELARHTDVHDQLDATISVLQQDINCVDLDGQHARDKSASLEMTLQGLRKEIEAQHLRSNQLDTSVVSADMALAKQVDELNTFGRDLTSKLFSANDQLARLRTQHDKIAREVAEAESADVHAEALSLVQESVAKSEAELTVKSADVRRCDRDHSEVEQALSDLEAALLGAHQELIESESEVARQDESSLSDESQAHQRTAELQNRIEQLRSESATKRKDEHDTLRLCDEAKEALIHKQNTMRDQRRRLEELEAKARSTALNTKDKHADLDETMRGIEKCSERMAIHHQADELHRAELDATSVSLDIERVRGDELRESLRGLCTQWKDRLQDTRKAIGDMSTHHSEAEEQMCRVKEEHGSLRERVSIVAGSRQAADDRLVRVRRDSMLANAEYGDQLKRVSAKLVALKAKGDAAENSASAVESSLTHTTKDHSDAKSEHARLTELKTEYQERLLKSRVEEEQICETDVDKQLECLIGHRAELQGAEAAARRRSSELNSQLEEVEASVAMVHRLEKDCKSREDMLLKAREDHKRLTAAHKNELDQTRRSIEQGVADILEEKNADMDRRIERIDELEREVLQLSSQIDFTSEEISAVKARIDISKSEGVNAAARAASCLVRLKGTQAELRDAESVQREHEEHVVAAERTAVRTREAMEMVRAEVAAHVEELGSLRNVSMEIGEEHRARMEHIVSTASMEEHARESVISHTEALKNEVALRRARSEACESKFRLSKEHVERLVGELADAERDNEALQLSNGLQPLETGRGTAEEKKELTALLSEQMSSRNDALAQAESDANDKDRKANQVQAELQQLREQMQSIEDKLAYQIEHAQLQFASSEKIREEIQALEREADILTLGLHETEQKNEFLQKENFLMKQQIEGLYQGSLQDWALEVHRVKVAAEVERKKDELSHWRQVAEDALRGVHVELDGAAKRNDEVESTLRRELDELPETIQRCESKLKSVQDQLPPPNKVVQTVPCSLHGFLVPPRRALAMAAAAKGGGGQRRRALLVGCNCSAWHAPLRGCANDAWNVQCLLRHSLHYREEDVRCLIDSSQSCPSPPHARPTKANILEGLQWLVSNARPGDSVVFMFAGYATRLPSANSDGKYEVCLVPSDFTEDLPPSFLQGEVTAGKSYRMLLMSDLRRLLARLPKGCKATVLLDTGASAFPDLRATPGSILQGAVDTGMKDVDASLLQGWDCRTRWLDLPMLPVCHEALDTLGGGRLSLQPRSGMTAGSMQLPPGSRNLQPIGAGQSLQLPIGGVSGAVAAQANARPALASGPSLLLTCACHCFGASRGDRGCVELSIEGVFQGAFTWAFVKALTACHLESTLVQYSRYLESILGDLQSHFRGLEQSPVLQLGGFGKPEDLVLLT